MAESVDGQVSVVDKQALETTSENELAPVKLVTAKLFSVTEVNYTR